MQSIYWISTSVVSVFLILSAYSYLFSKSTIEGIQELGLPSYLRIEFAVLKVIAAVLLLIPQLPLPVKEWVYAGIGLFLVTAIVAHAAHQDSFGLHLINLFLIGLLITSRVYLP